MTAPLLGLVLAGGRSARMGEDKGAIAYHGRSQRTHTAALLAPCCEAVYVSVRPDQVGDLEPDLTPLLDPRSDIGPMAGLLAAFTQRPDAAWLVVACDLPLMNEEAVQALVEARGDGVEAIAFTGTDGRPEPMAALWEPAMGPKLLEAATAGRYSLRDVLRSSACRCLPAPASTLLDADTPEARQSAQQQLD